MAIATRSCRPIAMSAIVFRCGSAGAFPRWAPQAGNHDELQPSEKPMGSRSARWLSRSIRSYRFRAHLISRPLADKPRMLGDAKFGLAASPQQRLPGLNRPDVE